MEWILNLWTEGSWYDRVYLTTAILFIVFGGLFLVFVIPYYNVASKINMEYKRLCSGHFFVSLRAKKQSELFQKAKYKVSSYDRKYPFYVLGDLFSTVSVISFVITFWFFLGSHVYEYVLNMTQDNISQINSNDIDTSDNDADIETYNDDNIHHVDPHSVDGYERSDGTEVDGYWRGGEDGYDRSDPDGDTSNNLDSSDNSVDDYNSVGETVEDWGEGVVDSIFDN